MLEDVGHADGPNKGRAGVERRPRIQPWPTAMTSTNGAPRGGDAHPLERLGVERPSLPPARSCSAGPTTDCDRRHERGVPARRRARWPGPRRRGRRPPRPAPTSQEPRGPWSRTRGRCRSRRSRTEQASPGRARPGARVPRWPTMAVSPSTYSGSATSAPRAGRATATISRSRGRVMGAAWAMAAVWSLPPRGGGDGVGWSRATVGVLCWRRPATKSTLPPWPRPSPDHAPPETTRSWPSLSRPWARWWPSRCTCSATRPWSATWAPCPWPGSPLAGLLLSEIVGFCTFLGTGPRPARPGWWAPGGRSTPSTPVSRPPGSPPGWDLALVAAMRLTAGPGCSFWPVAGRPPTPGARVDAHRRPRRPVRAGHGRGPGWIAASPHPTPLVGHRRGPRLGIALSAPPGLRRRARPRGSAIANVTAQALAAAEAHRGAPPGGGRRCGPAWARMRSQLAAAPT